VCHHHSAQLQSVQIYLRSAADYVLRGLLQDLTLTITTERSESEVDLEEDCSEISSINVQSFVDEQEWKLHSHVETWKRVSSKAYQNTKHKHPAFSTSCRASRRPGFFIWNIFLVMVRSLCLPWSSVAYQIELRTGLERVNDTITFIHI